MTTQESATSRSSDEKALPDAIRTTAVAINLCLANKFFKAQKLLEPWAKESMYHALGYGTIMFLQAVMTFEPQTIEQAKESIKIALDVCDRQRHKQSWSESLSSWIWTPSYEGITEEERHAELCYAECLLQRALLTFIQDENLISFIRGALKIKACYNSYKTCSNMVVNQSDGLKKSAQREDFEGGVHLGIGSFNLLLSLLPTRILKILEYIGFSGDKEAGLEHLDKGCKGNSLRSPMCAMILLAHHSVITYYLGIGDGDIDYAEEVLQPFIKAFPKGAIFLYFAGRIKQVQGRLEEAEERYNYSIKVQSEWKQFHHICYWELMWCYSFQDNWAMAYRYASILLKDSRWSKTTYMYLKASFKFMAQLTEQQIPKDDDNSAEDKVEYMFRHLPDFKQRIAGKSIPFEKYSVHKSVKYFDQGNWLFLPGLELIYMWNGFHVLRRRPDLTENLLRLVLKEQQKLEQHQDRQNYVDDWCLGKILEGMCYQCMRKTDKSLECLLAVVERSKDLVTDHQLGAYACAEVGFLYMDQGDYVLAKKYLKCCSQEYQVYFLESRLHFRIHAASNKLRKMKTEYKLAKKTGKPVKNNNLMEFSVTDDSSVSAETASNYSTADEGGDDGGDFGIAIEDNFVDACDAIESLDLKRLAVNGGVNKTGVLPDIVQPSKQSQNASHHNKTKPSVLHVTSL